MTCISATKKASLQATITRYETMLTAAVLSWTSSISDGNQSYTFDAGNGEASQSAKSIDSSVLFDQIKKLQAEIDYHNNLLNGAGLINMVLRRDAQDIICGVA